MPAEKTKMEAKLGFFTKRMGAGIAKRMDERNWRV